MNVVTKSGTNEFSGSSFLFVRNHGMVSRLPRSPLDAARGVAVDDERYAVDEFHRYNWGASLGGPIRRDRTHFFLSYDQTAQDQPFLRDIRGRGQYDAVLTRFPELLAGFQPNDDGIAAADADRGRTASGQFVRGTDNLILFAKLNHRVNDGTRSSSATTSPTTAAFPTSSAKSPAGSWRATRWWARWCRSSGSGV